jgi:hypothetical protein
MGRALRPRGAAPCVWLAEVCAGEGLVGRLEGVVRGLGNLTAAALSPGEPPVSYAGSSVGA